MKEGAIVKSAIQWLCLHGCDVIRNNTGAFKTDKGHYLRFGKKGSGDVLACSPHGKWIEIECKFNNNKQSIDQLIRQKEIEKRGGIYIVAYSIDDLEKRKTEIINK